MKGCNNTITAPFTILLPGSLFPDKGLQSLVIARCYGFWFWILPVLQDNYSTKNYYITSHKSVMHYICSKVLRLTIKSDKFSHFTTPADGQHTKKKGHHYPNHFLTVQPTLVNFANFLGEWMVCKLSTHSHIIRNMLMPISL